MEFHRQRARKRKREYRKKEQKINKKEMSDLTKCRAMTADNKRGKL